MALWDVLKASVTDVIKNNGNEEITGQVLQNTLANMITTVGEHATFAGLATTDTNPGTPDGPVFYVSNEEGTYSNFGGLELSGVCFIVWDGSTWSSITIIENLISRINNLEQGYSSVTNTLETQASQISSINSEISALNTELSVAVSDINSNISDLRDSINETISELETDLRVAEKDIATNQSDITDLQNAVWPLTVSFSASSTLLEYTGEAKSVTLSWSVTRNGAAVTPDSVVITYGNNVEVYNGTDSSGSVATSLNQSGARTFTITVTSGNLTATSTVTVRMLPPIYIGFYEEQTLDGAVTILGNKYTKTSIAGTYEVTQDIAGGGYLWICSPDFVGTVSRVTLNGFDVPMLDVQTVVTDLATYYCYCSYNMLTAGTYTFVIE